MRGGLDVYNGAEVQTFRRYFLSWGAASQIVVDTPLLYLLAVDGGHMKSAFGGVCLAAIVATANLKIFPAAWAVVDSENEENCLWFFEQVVRCFVGIHFVWMTDQGSALTCDAIGQLLEREDQLESLCAKHVIKTIEVARTRKEISGALTGVRELVYRFARSRTREWGDKILMEIERKNPYVSKYLRDRRDKIEASSFLENDRRRGGRITSQLVESFFNMVRPFREKGLVDGIIWMCKKFQAVQVDERESLKRWLSKDYKGERITCLSRVASAKFFELVGGKDDAFRVENLLCTDLELSGNVVRTTDGSARQIRISRANVGGRMVIDCPCLTRQECGFPCARATQLLVEGGWCRPGLPAGSVAEYLSVDAWKLQSSIDIVIPAEPAWLRDFNKLNPSGPLKALISDVQTLKLFPGRIPAPAGRPKLVKRAKKLFNSHFGRLKSVTERGDAKKKSKLVEREMAGEGDDEVIVVDEDVPELLENEEIGEIGDAEDGNEDSGPATGRVGEEILEQRVAKSVSDLWLVENEAKKKTRKEARCASCGAFGHKWPKCRFRNIELMLVNINAMPSEPILSPPRPVADEGVKAVEGSLVQQVLEVGPEQVNVVPAVEKHVEKSRKTKKRANVVTCVRCHQETLHESLRLFGTRCSSCKCNFIHFSCANSRDWACDDCQGGQSANM